MITISKNSCLINSSNLRIVSRTISDKDMDSTLIEIIIEKHFKHKEKIGHLNIKDTYVSDD